MAGFDVTGCKTTAIPFGTFCFIRKTTKQESSKFYSDLRNASILPSTTVPTVAIAQLLRQLD